MIITVIIIIILIPFLLSIVICVSVSKPNRFPREPLRGKRSLASAMLSLALGSAVYCALANTLQGLIFTLFSFSKPNVSASDKINLSPASQARMKHCVFMGVEENILKDECLIILKDTLFLFDIYKLLFANKAFLTMLYSSRTWQRCRRHLCGITQHSTDASRKLQRVLLGETELGCGLWQYVHCQIKFPSSVKWLNSVGMEGIRRFPIGAEESKAPFYKSENQDLERSDPRSLQKSEGARTLPLLPLPSPFLTFRAAEATSPLSSRRLPSLLRSVGFEPLQPLPYNRCSAKCSQVAEPEFQSLPQVQLPRTGWEPVATSLTISHHFSYSATEPPLGTETSHFHFLLREICSPPFLVAALLLLSLVLVTPEAARPKWPRPPLSVLLPGRCRHLPGAPGASEEELSLPGYSSVSRPKGSLVVHPVPCCLNHVMAALAAVKQTTQL